MTQKKASAFPPAAVYDIKIPRGLPKLDGKLTRKQRVEVAMDVLALLKIRSKKFVKLDLCSTYLDTGDAELPDSGQLHTSRIKGECLVCARGMLFLASVDRFNHLDLAKSDPEDEVIGRTREEWGDSQVELIEEAFEDMYGFSKAASAFYHKNGGHSNRKGVMRAICQNIIDNHGEFIP